MAGISDDDLATLNRLQKRLDRDINGYPMRDRSVRRRLGFKHLDAYYDGEQRLDQLGYAVPDDLREFITIVAWPGTYVDALVERAKVEGFRLAGQAEADSSLWEIWQANNLDSESPFARTDRKVFGRGYYCLGAADSADELPLITVESPMQMVHEWSNRKRAVTAAARFYVDESGGTKTRHATLYQPNSTRWLVRDRGVWVDDQEPDFHNLGRTLVVPFVGKQRAHDRYGLSAMGRLIGITDAAARALTNAQVATEVMALPQRWAAGLSPEDFKDPQSGDQLTTWEAYFGAVWSSTNQETKFGEFSAGDLSNFTKIISHYAQMSSGITGLPMRYFGQLSDNPPSADGIRADESRMVQTVESDNNAEAGTLEEVMSIAVRLRDGEWDTDLRMLETLHRNPSTPTTSQAADATVKLFTAGVISKRQARTDMGYTPVQIANMEDDDLREANDPVTGQLAKGLIDAAGGTGGAA